MSLWKKELSAFKYAFTGLFTHISTELHFRIHLIAASIAILIGLLLQISPIEWCMISFCITQVLVAESFNSAIEALTDLTEPSVNSKAKFVKDVAASAVLLAAICSLLIGAIVFLPKIFALFKL